MIKLQFGVEELKRLIGGDTQVEIDLRQAIVEEFSRKYIKSLVASDNFCSKCGEAARNVKQEINSLLEVELEKMGIKLEMMSSGSYRVTLPSPVKQVIRDQIGLLIQDIVEQEVDRQLSKINVEDLVREQLDEKMNQLVKHALAEHTADIFNTIRKNLGTR